MPNNRIELEMGNEKALAAIESVLAKLRQAEEAANRLAAKAGSAGMADPAFRGALQGVAGAQGALSAVQSLQASAQAGVAPITEASLGQAIQQGSRLGVGVIGQIPGGLPAGAMLGAAQQAAALSGGGYTPAFDPAAFSASVLQSAGVAGGAAGGAQGGGSPSAPVPQGGGARHIPGIIVNPPQIVPHAPAPTAPAAPPPAPAVPPTPPPVAPVMPSAVPAPQAPGVVNATATATATATAGGWAGLARGFGMRNLVAYGGIGFAAYGANQMIGAMSDSYAARFSAPYRAETGLMATAAAGQYVGPGERAGQLAAGEIEGQIAGDRAEHGIYNWLPIVGKMMESRVEVNRLLPMERAAAAARGMGHADDVRRHLGAMGITRRGGAIDPTLDAQYSGALAMSGFGGAARAAGAALMSDRGMLDMWGEEAMSRAMGAVASQGMSPGNLGLRESIISGASLYTIAPRAAMSAAARGDLGAVGAMAPFVDGRTYRSAVRVGADVLNYQGIAQGYASDVSSGSAIRSGALLHGMSPMSSQYANVTKGIIGDMTAEIEARHSEYLTVSKALGADHPDTKAARARFNQATLGRDQAMADAYTSQLGTISSEGALRMANRSVQSTTAGLYGSDADITEATRGRFSDIDTQVGALRSRLKAAHGSIPYETELAVNTDIQHLLQQKAGLSAGLSEELLGRTQARYGANYAGAQMAITGSTLYGNAAGIASAYAGASQVTAGMIGQLQSQMQGAPVMMQEQMKAQVAQLQQQWLQLQSGGAAAQVARGEMGTAVPMAQGSLATHKALRTGTAGDVRQATEQQMAAIQARIKMYEEQLKNPALSEEQKTQIKVNITDLEGQSYDAKQTGIDSAYQKEDLAGFGMDQMRLSQRQRRLASSPYAPGYRFGMALEGVGMRRRRMSQLASRRAALGATGNLSPERDFALQSEMEEMQTQNVEAVASIAEGVENRLPALSAGRPGRFSRMDSMQLAAMNLGRMGHPGRSMGSMGGRQLAMQDAFVRDLVGDLDVSPRSSTGAINSGFGAGGTARMEKQLERIATALERGGGSSLRPGEERGRVGALIGNRSSSNQGGFN